MRLLLTQVVLLYIVTRGVAVGMRLVQKFSSPSSRLVPKKATGSHENIVTNPFNEEMVGECI